METTKLTDLKQYNLSILEENELQTINGGYVLAGGDSATSLLFRVGDWIGEKVGTLSKNLASLDWTGSFAGY